MNNKLVKFLSENYPSLVNEHDDGTYEVNFNKLKEELNDVNISDETYGINWLGKSYARVLRDYPVKTLIEPDKEHNNQEENKNSNNVYIEGDNLEVLKHLKNAYNNKIKMIYIDPPYNTGSDGFVYNDKFNFSVEDFMNLANVDKEEAKKILDYTSNSHSTHSAWLTFMYPRLYIARELLTDDGVIFISIDENEYSQLKLLCDEIFGENNFVGSFIRKTVTNRAMAKKISNNYEFLVCYSKNISCFSLFADEKDLSSYKYEDEHGRYKTDDPTMKNSKNREKIINPYTGEIELPPQGRGWRWKEENFNKLVDNGIIEFRTDPKDNRRSFIYKTYLKKDLDKYNILNTLCFSDNEFLNLYGSKDIFKLFDEDLFSYPKPVKFIEKIISFNKKKILLY